MRQKKTSRAEQVRRLKLAVAGEEKYFPGVLGSPVTFAARWGLSLSNHQRSKTKTARPASAKPALQPGESLARKTGPTLHGRLHMSD